MPVKVYLIHALKEPYKKNITILLILQMWRWGSEREVQDGSGSSGIRGAFTQANLPLLSAGQPVFPR